MIYRYHIGGLSVASDIQIAGARPVPGVAGPDVTIEQGVVPLVLETATTSHRNWTADASRLLARTPKARFLVSDGQRIVYAPEPGFGVEDCAAFLGGSIFGFLMHQRGSIVLHASAVSIAGSAVLFCGPSGFGKSTLAAAMCQRGHGLLADDFCVVSFDPSGAPVIHSDARKHRLTEASLEALKPSGVEGAVAPDIAKYYVEPAVSAELGTIPLEAVHVLARGTEPAIEALSTAEAARALSRNAYRPIVVRKMGQTQLYLDAATIILRHASVSRLTLSSALESLDTAIALIERDLHGMKNSNSASEGRLR